MSWSDPVAGTSARQAATLTIGGQQLPGAAGTYDVHNPARPAEVVGRAPAADRSQLDAAVMAARRAGPAWTELDSSERLAAVVAAAAAAAAHAAQVELDVLYTREHGKVRAEAKFEIDAAPAIAAILGDLAAPALAVESVDAGSAYPRLQREPFGVAALILPFNWPVALVMTKLTSALVAGNTAVVKAPPSCPFAVLEFGAAFAAALPAGVVNVLTAPGPDLGAWLVTHPHVDVVSFTGGVETGRAVMTAAASRLTPVLLELGGNDAAIIAPDLPIDDALAATLARATFTTSGQVCMAVKRLYVPRQRTAELAEALLASCDREVIGDGLAEEVTLGPLHTAHGRDRVRRLIDDARAGGAQVRSAGRLRDEDRDSGGHFMLPTVVTDAPPDVALVATEQFGPVVPILGYDDIDDAVTAANATDFGLTASVWSREEALAERVASSLVAGTVSINCHGMDAQDPRVPFGGVRQSGMGRELGAEGIRAFTQTRTFVRRPAPG